MSLTGRAQKHLGITNNGSHLGNLNGRFYDLYSVATIATAGNATLTAAQLLGGMILRDPNGGARTDTTPTATQIRNALGSQLKNNLGFKFTIRNTADASETITLGAGSGVTISGTATIAQNNSKEFLVVVTNKSTPTVTIYSLGTVVH